MFWLYTSVVKVYLALWEDEDLFGTHDLEEEFEKLDDKEKNEDKEEENQEDKDDKDMQKEDNMEN